MVRVAERAIDDVPSLLVGQLLFVDEDAEKLDGRYSWVSIV